MREREIEDFLIERPKKEAAERLAVVQEAASWLGTPYHQNGDVKGAGVDCGMLLIRVFADLKLIPKFDPRPYPIQWAFNQRAERYLEIVQRFATEFSWAGTSRRRSPVQGRSLLGARRHSHTLA
jgi:hypothetical protein